MISLERRGHVLVIGLDRPDALNALSPELIERLASAVEGADRNEIVRAVVITGSERAFCAGADITAITDIARDELLAVDGFPRRLFDVLGRCRTPLVAAVRGVALGGGCELALACDVIIAAEGARFGLPEVKLGVIPGAGGTQRLVHAVGKARAMRMLLTGDPIPAAEALACGLVSEVVPDTAVLDTAIAIAERIAGNGPLAVQLAKDAACAALELGLTHGLAHERRNFFLSLDTQDAHEGVQAFLEKRRPMFTGR